MKKETEKKRDPWTDPDPQPGDFDEYLDEMEPVEVIFDPDLEIRRVSDAELAKRVGKPGVQIGRWETGVVAPSLDTLLELLRACGFDGPLILHGLAEEDVPQAAAFLRRVLDP